MDILEIRAANFAEVRAHWQAFVNTLLNLKVCHPRCVVIKHTVVVSDSQ
jgi:hypothetical protein